LIPLTCLKNDWKYLMAILNRPDNTKELISQETISKNKNGELFKFYFNLLSPEALETLNRIHLDDLDIFNYSFDPIKKLIGGWDWKFYLRWTKFSRLYFRSVMIFGKSEFSGNRDLFGSENSRIWFSQIFNIFKQFKTFCGVMKMIHDDVIVFIH